MGKSLSLNIAENNFDISVYNRVDSGEESVVSDFLEKNKSFKNICGYTNINKFIDSLERPRKILIMIKAGKAIDAVIEQLLPFLIDGDIIIDGGNSYYLDTKERSNYLAEKNINFVGCGISGGEEGARKGPSLMPGATPDSYKLLAPVLEAIAARDKNNKPCCAYIGPEGAGHFVKMVHNGMEYVEMQLLAEVYALLSLTMNNDDIAAVFSEWNNTDLSSYLLEITINILKKKKGDTYIVDTILDKAGNKGTGSWSSKVAFDLGTVNTMMSSAVFARYISSFKEKRVLLSKAITTPKKLLEKPDIAAIEKAYRFARIINHHQGFELMRLASNEYNWNLNLSEIARIWTNGCIIRSKFMEESVDVFKKHKTYLDSKSVLNILLSSEKEIIEGITCSMSNRVAFDTFSSAYNYWISITTKNLPANLIWCTYLST
jgi:6-phosphogluconate dehydrogenase